MLASGLASRRRGGVPRVSCGGSGSITNERPGALEPAGWERILDAAREASNPKAMTFVLWEGTGQPAGLN